MTWRGPSKVNACDEGNKVIRKSSMIIESKNTLFTMNNKLAEGGLDVKLLKTVCLIYIHIKKAGSEFRIQPDGSGVPNGI